MKRIALGLIGLMLSIVSLAAINPEDKLLDAVKKYTSKDYLGAVALLSELIQESPDNDAACYYMALSKLGLGETDVAEAYFERAVKLDPHNFWYRHRLAAYYGLTSRTDDAIELYKALLKEFPKNSQIYYDLFELYASSQKNVEALDVLKSIEDVFGESDAVVMQRFKLLLAMEKQDEAIECLKQYNEKYSSPFVLTTLADYEMSIYNDKLAHKYYDEVLDIFPDYTPALIGKAEAYRLTRRDDDYFKILSTFVSSRNISSVEKAGYLEAILTQSMPAYIKASAERLDSLLNKALDINPADTLILPLKGLLYIKTNEFERAESEFRKNIVLNPSHQGARESWVEFLAFRKKWDMLASESALATEIFPTNSKFIEMEIYAHYNQKHWPEIISLCQKIIRLFPQDKEKLVDAWSNMGDVYYIMGKKKDSFKAYDKVLQMDPNNIYVLNNYAYYLSLGKTRLKKAASMSKKTIVAAPDNPTYLDTYAWILYLQGKSQEAKPHFKHAMLYGGKDSVVIMDHYAEVLFKLGEYDLAFVYWNRIKSMNYKEDIPDLDERLEKRKQQMKKKK